MHVKMKGETNDKIITGITWNYVLCSDIKSPINYFLP